MLNNLSNFFEKGNSFSSIDTAKCALAFIMTVASCQSLNDHPLNFNLTNEVYLGLGRFIYIFRKLQTHWLLYDKALTCKFSLLPQTWFI